jgi:hypothetical protein
MFPRTQPPVRRTKGIWCIRPHNRTGHIPWVISFLATRSPLISGKHLPGITNDARSCPDPLSPFRCMWAAITPCGPRLRCIWAAVPFDVGHDYGETENAAHIATQSRPTSHRNQRPTSNGITGPLGPEYATVHAGLLQHVGPALKIKANRSSGSKRS